MTVVCGEKQTDPESSTTITNPTLIVEVVSDSTELYDRGEKFEHYKKIPSLRAVVFVSQREPRIDVWSRPEEEADWQLETYGGGERAALEAIDCTLDLAAVYGVL